MPASWKPFTGRPPPCAAQLVLPAPPSSRRVRCRCDGSPPATCTPTDVLERFWRARGVADDAHIARLIECGTQAPEGDAGAAAAWDPAEPLPGVSTYWQLERSAAAVALVRAVSVRLLELHSLLGSRPDISAADMLVREPRLLTAELPDIASRLVMMRTAEGAQTLDIGRIVEAQPALLLQDPGSADSPEAWSFGLASDGAAQWALWLQQLAAYKQLHGDAHVGHRAGEDPGLVRGARMHRAAFRKGQLPPDRVAALEALGFCFDAEEAEWRVMFQRFQASQQQAATAAHAAALPAAEDFLLTNWCSVQRIASRSGVLSGERRAQLEAAGFDWTGADALS